MLTAELKSQLDSLSTALLADARTRLKLPETHLDPGVRPATPFTRMAGVAMTVKLAVAGDESLADLSPLLDAFESPLEPGCIIVIEVPKELHKHGIFGEGAATLARRHGFVGALVEGAVRDTTELREMGFPAYSRTIAPGYIVGKVSVAASGEAVQIGGETIRTGDVIVADNDGVIVVEPEELENVVARALAIKEWERRAHELLAQGKSHQEVSELAGPMP
jgi:4-hydroxy-4-methyl-2-oxoglutarate aldolase